VSSGGGCGLSFAAEVVGVLLERVEPALEISTDEVGLLGGMSEPGKGTSSRGSKRACSGSRESTIGMLEAPLKRLIFFARATRDERRRWRIEEGGRLESSWDSCFDLFCEANVTGRGAMQNKGILRLRIMCRESGVGDVDIEGQDC
jgi:hypothetical protein